MGERKEGREGGWRMGRWMGRRMSGREEAGQGKQKDGGVIKERWGRDSLVDGWVICWMDHGGSIRDRDSVSVNPHASSHAFFVVYPLKFALFPPFPSFLPEHGLSPLTVPSL